MNYLEKYTVAQLRDIATEWRMPGLSFTTKTRKPELVSAIAAKVDYLHGEALTEDAQRAEIELLPDFEMTVAMSDEARADNYRRQNGSDRLTYKQRRRLRKKAHRKLGRELAKMEAGR